MRNLVKVLIVLMGLVAVNACSKSNTNNISPAAAAAGFMKATIGDSAFSVSGATGAYAGMVTSGGVNTITIYGITAWNKTIQIVLYNDTGKGTFALPSLTASAAYYANGLSGGSYTYAQSGTVYITQYSPTLVGSFNFVCNDNAHTHIGNGTFSVPLP